MLQVFFVLIVWEKSWAVAGKYWKSELIITEKVGIVPCFGKVRIADIYIIYNKNRYGGRDYVMNQRNSGNYSSSASIFTGGLCGRVQSGCECCWI